MPRPRAPSLLAIVFAASCCGLPSAAWSASPSARPEHIHAAPAGVELTRDTLVRRMLAARVVYLGEQHDSARHHDIQLSLLEEMVARGARPALGLEMFARERSAAMMGYVAWQPSPRMKNADSAEAWLRARLGGDDAADWRSTWDAYAALLAAARRHGLTLFGIDLPLSLRDRISRVGVDGLSHVERAGFSPTGFSDPTYRSLMKERIKAAHCGFGSPDYLDRLYQAWVARNDAMARAIVAALADAGDSPVVIIVGAGHLEHDMGVVERVAALVPGIEQVNLAMRDIGPESVAVAEHFQARVHEGRRFGPEHGYLWFTEAEGVGVDHCAGFAELMSGMGQASSEN